MIETLKQWAALRGEKLQVFPAGRLQDIQIEIEDFRANEDLNGFHKWITTNLYKFDLPAAEFTIRSIFLMAIPHPFYANVGFVRNGKKYQFVSLVVSEIDQTESELTSILAAQGYQIKPAIDLPLKRLAVKSGLAVYGRNNICYVDGMGSSFLFAAYFSDLPCETADWLELRLAERCANCQACFNNCPTGAIRRERFLIDNERCLSNLNESPGEFPAWLPETAHHCLYDCLKCQAICPMNKDILQNIGEPVEFDEEETSMLLAGNPLDTFSSEFQEKARRLGIERWFSNIPRNLRVLMDLSDRQLYVYR